MMRILPYYIIHTFINSIKKIFKTWVIIFIAVMALIGGIIGVTVGIISEKIPDSDTASYSETVDEEIEDTLSDVDDSISPIEAKYIIEIAISLLSIIVIVSTISSGDKSGAKIFNKADVNFLFACPMKPQSVLLFKTILQMGVVLYSSIYLIFQLPNFVNMASLGIKGFFVLIFTWLLIIVFSQLSLVLTYTVVAGNENLRKYTRFLALSVFVIILGIFGGMVYSGKYGFFEALITLFASKYGRYVPIFGWFRGFAMSALYGDLLNATIYFVLLAIGAGLLIYFIWNIKADFYEDALKHADEIEEIIQKSNNGISVKGKKTKSSKIKKECEFTCNGAKVFLQKVINNRKRFAKFLGLTATCQTYSIIAICCCVFIKYVAKSDTLLPLGFTLLVFVYFRNLGNPISSETSLNFLYMVPESPYKKLYYTLAGSVYESACDLLPASIISIVLGFNTIQAILWYLTWVSLDIFCSSVGSAIELILPSSVVDTIKGLIGLSISLSALLPGGLLLIYGIITSKMVFALCMVIVLNIAVATVLFSFVPKFLHLGK